MNTTQKGDELEDKVFELFEENISSGRFIAPKECCRIYKKKKYYSKDREAYIEIDVSIEIFIPGQETCFLYVLIECKNLKRSVEGGDVEEFFTKAQQIAVANLKAIVVSNNSFQSAAFNFSKSKGIGLLRYFDRSNLEWVLNRSPSSLVSSRYALNEWSTAREGLHSEDFESKYFDFYGCVGYEYTNSLSLFISSLIKHDEDKEFLESLAVVESIDEKETWLVKYMEEFEIEEICNSVLEKVGYGFGEVPLDDICAFLKDEHGLRVIETSSLKDGVLGQIAFDPLEIQIAKEQESKARKRFTLAHEIGHFLLGHSAYMSGEKCHESSMDLEDPVDVGIRDIVRMEWQANQLASCLLLPKQDFVQSFLSVGARNGLSDRGFGILYLDNQHCNKSKFFSIAAPLMKKYKVSRTVVKIRLKKLGYINEPVQKAVKPMPMFGHLRR